MVLKNRVSKVNKSKKEKNLLHGEGLWFFVSDEKKVIIWKEEEEEKNKD